MATQSAPCRDAPPRAQRGQSLTEGLVASVFVLVPLFLGVPLLGKYIDIKLAAVEAARYEAWEYTVWRDVSDVGTSPFPWNFRALAPLNAGQSCGGAGLQPFKDSAATHREAENRFFTGVAALPGQIRKVRSADCASPLAAAGVNSLWQDHQRQPLLAQRPVNIEANGRTQTVALFGFDVTAMLGYARGMIGMVQGLFSTIMSFFASSPVQYARFSADNMDGRVSAHVELAVRVRDDVVATRSTLGAPAPASAATKPFTGDAAVLSEGWNAGGTIHAKNQVNGVTPVTLLAAGYASRLPLPVKSPVPIPTAASDVVSIFAPELTPCTPPPSFGQQVAAQIDAVTGGNFMQNFYGTFVPANGSLWLGYMDGDVVHPDRLSDPPRILADTGLGSQICGPDGRCEWDATVKTNTASKPLSHSPCN